MSRFSGGAQPPGFDIAMVTGSRYEPSKLSAPSSPLGSENRGRRLGPTSTLSVRAASHAIVQSVVRLTGSRRAPVGRAPLNGRQPVLKTGDG